MEEKRFQEYGKLFVSNNRKSVIHHHSCYATLTKEELRKAKVVTFFNQIVHIKEVYVCGFRKGMDVLYGFSTILIDTEDNDKIWIIDYPLTEANRYLDGNFDNQKNIDKFIAWHKEKYR